ncbi:MAG: TonB family protein [Longimicrobiales bacterium]
MIDRTDSGLDLPPELAPLDRELSSITIEERPSFGPELEAELEREWASPVAKRRFRPAHAIAAGLGALMIAGLSAPQARASIARLFNLADEPEADAIQVTVPERPIPIPSVEVHREEAPATDGIVTLERSTGAPGAPLLNAQRPTPLDVVFPKLLNRDEYERSLAERYPPELAEAGIGGTVQMHMWVNPNGAVDFVQVAGTSGVEALDRFAVEVAGELQFAPARRAGMILGAWVDLPLVFEADFGDRDALDRPAPIASPAVPFEIRAPLPESFVPGSFVSPPPSMVEAEALLRASLGEEAKPGGQWETTVSALLAGEPPSGIWPIRWRESSTVALEKAIRNNPDNPAPLLALGRIRRKQGLWGDARRLYEEGIRRATRLNGGVATALLAELHYERGKIVKQEWVAWSDLGRVPPSALQDSRCSAPRGETQGDQVPADVLIAWNYLCSAAFDRILRESFDPILPPEAQRRQEMLRSFHAAVRNAPAHIGANREILVDLADQQRWIELLDASQRFVEATQGHPTGLLMSGLALQRLGYSEEALQRFEMALLALPSKDARALEDISALQASRRSPDEMVVGLSREESERAFWAARDPVLSTAVNERRVEHLARGAYALLKFGDLRVAAANVVIRYGQPLNVRAFGEDSSSRTVFWGYGPGPDITFRRAVGSEHLDITAEAEEYLEDLLESVPHRFGLGSARMVYRLRGQAVLFRGDAPGAWEVDVYGDIPEEFTDLDGAVDVTIYVLGAGRERLSESRSTVRPSRGSTLRRSTEVAADATEVVVELFHPPTGLVALMRAPLRARADDVDSRVSDLLFVEPARPTPQSLLRRNGWMRPIAGPVVDADEVGVLFELYGVPSGRERYSVEVSMTGRDGSTRPVPLRTARDDDFAAFWEGSSRRERPVTQFLILDISNVEPGTYTVGLVATGVGMSTPAVSKKRLVIR